jgi:WD40 repeat protein
MPESLPADAPRTPSVANGPADEATTLPPGPVDEATTLPPSPPQPDDLPASGPAVPGYEILGELGRGGMGVVYRARQVKLNRPVALKMILAGGHAGPDELARFQAEAEAVGRLQHPNIVQIHEVGESEGRPFFSLEFVAGGSLASRLDGTPWPAPQAARLVETLAGAMHAAHQQGIIHRDLKPANVLLAADGAPKITDFGLAKRLDPEAVGQTESGAILGTPSYMAPEQAGGRTKEVGPAADTYALGAILYELLTGRPPFRAATALDTILQVIADEPAAPTDLNAKVPRDLETVCLKCLRKEPAKRYASAAELADDLRRYQNGEPIRARPVGAVEKAAKWARRRPAAAAALAASLAALVLLAAVAALAPFAWVQMRAAEVNLGKANEEAEHARESAATAETRRQEAVAARDRARRSAYAITVRQAWEEWDANRPWRAAQYLDEADPELRGWEWGHLYQRMHADERTFRHTGSVASLAFSPDGKRLAAGGYDRRARVWDVATGEEVLALPAHVLAVKHIAFGPDGSRLVTLAAFPGGSTESAVHLWDGATGRQLLHLPGHSEPAFGPDGKLLATAQGRKNVAVHDAATGGAVSSFAVPEGVREGPYFLPGGKHVLLKDGKGAVRLWDAATGKEGESLSTKYQTPNLKIVPGAGGRWRGVVRVVNGPAVGLQLVDLETGQAVVAVAVTGDPLDGDGTYSPDGKLVARDEGAGGVALRTLRGAGPNPPPRKLAAPDFARPEFVFSPDGKWLVAFSYVARGEGRGVVRLWDTATGREGRRLRGHLDSVSAAQFTPDGKWLATASVDGTVRLWHPSSDPAVRTLPAYRGVALSLAFRPDGRVIGTGGLDRAVRLWDAATGEKLRELPGEAVAFHPANRTVAVSGTEYPAGQPRKAEYVVRLYDGETGEPGRVLKGHTAWVRALAFSPDGALLATAGGNGASSPGEGKLWDLAAGAEARALEGLQDHVLSLAFNADGSRLATAGGGDVVEEGKVVRTWGTVQVWDPATAREVLRLPPQPGWVLGVAFSPDGELLATAGRDGTVRLWSAADGQEVRLLKGHDGPVVAVAFSPDGQRLASAGDDGAVRLWDVLSGKELAAPQLGRAVQQLAFSPDGKWLATASNGGLGRPPGEVTFWQATYPPR